MVTFNTYKPLLQAASQQQAGLVAQSSAEPAPHTHTLTHKADSVVLRFGAEQDPGRRRFLGWLGRGVLAAAGVIPASQVLTAPPAAAAPVPATHEQALGNAIQYLKEPIQSVDRKAGKVEVTTKKGNKYTLKVLPKGEYPRRFIEMIVPIGYEQGVFTARSEGDPYTNVTIYMLNTKGANKTFNATDFRNGVYTALTNANKELPRGRKIPTDNIKV